MTQAPDRYNLRFISRIVAGIGLLIILLLLTTPSGWGAQRSVRGQVSCGSVLGSAPSNGGEVTDLRWDTTDRGRRAVSVEKRAQICDIKRDARLGWSLVAALPTVVALSVLATSLAGGPTRREG